MAMFAAAMVSVGCSTDVEHLQIDDASSVKAPVLADMSDIAVNGYTSAETVIFNCTPVSFGQSIAVKYEIWLTNALAADDENYLEARLATAYTPQLSVQKSDINGLAINKLGIVANGTGEIGAYAVAYAGESSIASPKSNFITFGITTFKAPLRLIYLTGGINGWAASPYSPNDDGYYALSMWETGSGTNVFEAYFYFATEGDFKILGSDQGWDGPNYSYESFSKVSENISDDAADNHNLRIGAGIYQITVNMSDMSVVATSVSKIGIVGDWSWDDDIELVYDAHENVWKSESAVDSREFKIRLNSAWDINYGGGATDAENMPEGEAAAYELVSGGDNIKSMPAGKHYVKLYADRTPWVIAYEAE